MMVIFAAIFGIFCHRASGFRTFWFVVLYKCIFPTTDFNITL